MADAAYEGMVDYRNRSSLKLLGDDRAENFICDAFVLACVSNGVHWPDHLPAAHHAEHGAFA
jgi:hypothetical protein